MKFNGLNYKVIKELYRTKGSYDQLLAENLPSHRIAENRRRFYIVERDGRKYFVKEYTERNYGGKLPFPKNIEYEFCETDRLRGAIRTEHGTIDVPEAIAIEDNRILLEYLEGYRRVRPSEVKNVLELVYKWVKEKSVDNYDLAPNNIMVKGDSVMMIDFECSDDRHPMQEFGLE